MAFSSTRILFFLIIFFFFTFLSNNNNNGVVEGSHKAYTEYQFRESKKVLEEHRTGFHFQPAKHWMNDPNGPMYYNGIYHLFYQYNPYGAVWGNIVWAHSVSTDLINWIPLDPAIVPSKPFDINGCWSGSVTILPGNKPVILYTGIDTEKRQVQNIAIPKNLSDPLLVEWIKPDYNPLMMPSLDMNVSSFRDPTTAWLGPDGHWRVLVGNKRRTRGMALLYRSRDFVHWTKAKHSFHSSPKLGMWECPDFFPVSLNGEEGIETSAVRDDVKHVLKVSLDARRFEYYTIGQYFHEKDRYIPDNSSIDDASGLRYDYGNFYASKTFFDARKNRRILWGWANESDSVADDNEKGWAGIQLIPRSLWLDEGGKQLKQWPIKEVETLRGHQIRMNDISIRNGGLVEIKGITAAQADVDATFHLPSLSNIHMEPFDPNWSDPEFLCGLKSSTVRGSLGPFGLLTLASENLEEYTTVFFQVFDAKPKPVVLMCSGGIKSSIGEEIYKPSFGGFVDVDLNDRKISLRTLIDHSVVESFGAGGKTCITSRVYPKLALKSAARLYAFNNGTETIKMKHLKAWNMERPRMN